MMKFMGLRVRDRLNVCVCVSVCAVFNLCVLYDVCVVVSTTCLLCQFLGGRGKGGKGEERGVPLA